jgi:hypothetical protein
MSINKINNEGNDKKQNKCIAPCYPKKTLYYNPLILQPTIRDHSSCPVEPYMDDDKMVAFKKCDKPSENYMNYDMFNEFVNIANTPKTFLEQIYNIDNYQNTISFLKNEQDFLPLYTQQRILNAIFLSYKLNSDFPNKIYILKFIEIFKKIYDINLNKSKITNKIIKYKNNNDIKNIFNHIHGKII